MELMDRDEARAWAARWKEVESAEIAELRRTPSDVKLRQLDALAQSAGLFDWSSDDRENERVRELWMRLRARSGVQ
jgi:hypothetical protein